MTEETVIEEKPEVAKKEHSPAKQKGSEFEAKIVELTENLTKQEEELKTLADNLNQEKDKALRAYAEMENFKKRKNQEHEELCKFANENLVKDLLPIIDSFERSHESITQNPENQQNLIEGYQLIYKQFKAVLEKHGVVQIACLNEKFDPNYHQAVLQEENSEVQEDTVVKECQKGYTICGRILRPAMVVVSK